MCSSDLSPSRFDFKKLANISGQHIARAPDEELLWELESYLEASNKPTLAESQRIAFLAGVYCVKSHAKTMGELFQKSSFMLNVRPILMDDKAQQNLNSNSANLLKDLTRQLQGVSWDRLSLEEVVKVLAQSQNMKMGELAAPIRSALSGRVASPSIFDMMLVLGREETVARIDDIG